MISGLAMNSGPVLTSSRSMSSTIDPLQHADLRRRQADAGRGVHRLQHVVHQLAHLGVDRLDRLGLLLEARIGRREDGQEGHGV